MGRRSITALVDPRDLSHHHPSSSYTSPTAVFELSPDDCCSHDEDANPFLYSPPKIHGSAVSHSKQSPLNSSRPLPRPLLAPSPSSRSSSTSSSASSSSSASTKSSSCSVGSPASPIHLTAAIKITGFRVDVPDRNPLDTLQSQSQPPQRPQFTPSSRRPSFSASEWVINSAPNSVTGGARTASGIGAEENSPPEDGVDFNKCLMARLARRSRRTQPPAHPQPIFV